jgi:protein involved in polysaccharide export with SLBB domain
VIEKHSGRNRNPDPGNKKIAAYFLIQAQEPNGNRVRIPKRFRHMSHADQDLGTARELKIQREKQRSGLFYERKKTRPVNSAKEKNTQTFNERNKDQVFSTREKNTTSEQRQRKKILRPSHHKERNNFSIEI